MITISNKNHPYVLMLTKHELESLGYALDEALDIHEQECLYAPDTASTLYEIKSEIKGLLN